MVLIPNLFASITIFIKFHLRFANFINWPNFDVCSLFYKNAFTSFNFYKMSSAIISKPFTISSFY